MRKAVVLLAVIVPIIAGCAGPAIGTRLTQGEGTGVICTPAQADNTVGIASDIMTNVTDKPIEVVDVTLDEGAQNLELLAAAVKPDLEHGYVGYPFGHYPLPGDGSGRVVPLTVDPGGQFLIEVKLSPTGQSYGWTNGLWVIARTQSGLVFRAHTCFVLIVQAHGTRCGDEIKDDDGYPQHGPWELCSVNESIQNFVDHS